MKSAVPTRGQLHLSVGGNLPSPSLVGGRHEVHRVLDTHSTCGKATDSRGRDGTFSAADFKTNLYLAGCGTWAWGVVGELGVCPLGDVDLIKLTLESLALAVLGLPPVPHHPRTARRRARR